MVSREDIDTARAMNDDAASDYVELPRRIEHGLETIDLGNKGLDRVCGGAYVSLRHLRHTHVRVEPVSKAADNGCKVFTVHGAPFQVKSGSG